MQMLVKMETGEPITRVPYETDFRRWMARMDQAEIDAIKASLNALIDGNEIHTAGWLPGSDWSDTPYDPIYRKAAQYDYTVSAKCFGLIVWEVFMERPEKWTSGRFEKNGEPIGSRTYFRVYHS